MISLHLFMFRKVCTSITVHVCCQVASFFHHSGILLAVSDDEASLRAMIQRHEVLVGQIQQLDSVRSQLVAQTQDAQLWAQVPQDQQTMLLTRLREVDDKLTELRAVSERTEAELLAAAQRMQARIAAAAASQMTQPAPQPQQPQQPEKAKATLSQLSTAASSPEQQPQHQAAPPSASTVIIQAPPLPLPPRNMNLTGLFEPEFEVLMIAKLRFDLSQC
jgi:electron transfer flavoprotein alpha subunit